MPAVRDLARGELSKPQEIALPVRVPNTRLAEALAAVAVYPLELEAAEGAKAIGVAVRDQLAGVASSTRIEIC